MYEVRDVSHNNLPIAEVPKLFAPRTPFWQTCCFADPFFANLLLREPLLCESIDFKSLFCESPILRGSNICDITIVVRLICDSNPVWCRFVCTTFVVESGVDGSIAVLTIAEHVALCDPVVVEMFALGTDYHSGTCIHI